MRKTGIARFRFHDLRHTFATRLIQAGINVYTVQKLGRWKMISMVLRYAHHQPEEFARGAEVLDRLRRESITNVAQRGLARAAEPIDKMVRPVGIEPTILSLEDRSRRKALKKFNAFGFQDEAERDRSPLSHARPAHYTFLRSDLQGYLTGGHRETLGERALDQIGSLLRAVRWSSCAAPFHREQAASGVAYLSGQPGGLFHSVVPRWAR